MSTALMWAVVGVATLLAIYGLSVSGYVLVLFMRRAFGLDEGRNSH